MKTAFLCVLLLCTLSFLSSAQDISGGQTLTPLAPPMAKREQIIHLHGTVRREVQFSGPSDLKTLQRRAYLDSIQDFQYQEIDAQDHIIIEFTDEPMFLVRRKSPGLHKTVSTDLYLSRFSQFAADAEGLHQLLHSTVTGHVAIRHEYFKAFFGVSMTVPSAMLPMIHRLPYVKAIHFDRDVHATIEPAIDLIGANTVWETFGPQGEGIRVGIIDSGIDYLHPALGGGFGPGFKVAGGYDIVNNDSDPMDDNGHGTHVAGIVAADADSFKGVAPRAKLYAYKALDAAGRGLDSDVI